MLKIILLRIIIYIVLVGASFVLGWLYKNNTLVKKFIQILIMIAQKYISPEGTIKNDFVVKIIVEIYKKIGIPAEEQSIKNKVDSIYNDMLEIVKNVSYTKNDIDYDNPENPIEKEERDKNITIESIKGIEGVENGSNIF